MKLNTDGSVYLLTLNDQEWYGITKAQQEDIITLCMRQAPKFGKYYISIVVQPDAVLPICEQKVRHQVWRHTFPTTDEEQLHDELLGLFDKYVKTKRLTIAQVRTYMNKVFK
jgi:hypothetical protein